MTIQQSPRPLDAFQPYSHTVTDDPDESQKNISVYNAMHPCPERYAMHVRAAFLDSLSAELLHQSVTAALAVAGVRTCLQQGFAQFVDVGSSGVNKNL